MRKPCRCRLDARLVTTTWVLVEVADGMADPRTRNAFGGLLSLLASHPSTEILKPDVEQFDRGAKLYLARGDKEWSLTDCISFEVMRERGITEALTGDRHFEQAGLVALMK